MSERKRSRSAVFACALALLCPAAARAAQVKGTAEAPAVAASIGRTLGHTRTRVSAPALGAAHRRADVAVLLSVKTSLPIPAAAEPYRVSLVGHRFVPSVAACVVDGKLAFTNDDRGPLTVLVDNQATVTLAPGETKTYDCTAPEPKLRRLQVKEWPHALATLVVGELGVVAQPGPGGAFTLSAPQGKYELQLIAREGIIARREVEVAARDVDVGRLAVGGTPSEGAPPAGARDAAKGAEGAPAGGAADNDKAGQP